MSLPLPRFLLAIALGALGAAGPSLAQRPPSPDSLLNVGYAALGAGDTLRAVSAFGRAVEAAPDAVRPRLELGYALSALGQPAEAAVHLARAAELDPPSAPRLDLGYLYLELDRPVEAAVEFEHVLDTSPDDAQTALQLAYVYAQIDRPNDAHLQFERAASTGGPAVRERALAELDARDPRPRAGAVTGEVYAAPLYQSRFRYVVAPFVARAGVTLDRSAALQAYGSLRAIRDTRSTGGLQPQIFNDNVAVAALGLRARPFGTGAPTVYGEVGAAVSLVENGAAQDGLDVRFGAFSYRRWGGRGPFGAVADLYADVGYYSRYDNVIGYVQARPGLRLADTPAGTADAYVALGAVFDSRGLSFNNLVEAGPGLRWTLPAQSGLELRAEYVRGRQFGLGGDPAVTYGDARVLLVFSRALRLSR